MIQIKGFIFPNFKLLDEESSVNKAGSLLRISSLTKVGVILSKSRNGLLISSSLPYCGDLTWPDTPLLVKWTAPENMVQVHRPGSGYFYHSLPGNHTFSSSFLTGSADTDGLTHPAKWWVEICEELVHLQLEFWLLAVLGASVEYKRKSIRSWISVECLLLLVFCVFSAGLLRINRHSVDKSHHEIV